MFNYDDPTHRAAIDIIKAQLHAETDAYRALADAYKTSLGKKADPSAASIKHMANMLPRSSIADFFQDWENRLTDLTDELDDEVTEGLEHVYANAALTLRALADHYEGQAKLWADKFKPTTPVKTDVPSLDKLQEASKKCSDTFKTLMGMVDQLKNAPSQTTVESIVGLSVTTRERKGNVEFMLEIPRFRTPRAKSSTSKASVTSSYRMVLFVDDEEVDGETFGDQCRKAFGMGSVDFLDRIKPLGWSFDEAFTYIHNGNEVAVTIEKMAVDE